jgi:uncharacterized membrane protein
MKQTNDAGLDLAKWLGGAAAGALLMYMLDPDRGSARRAQTTGALRDASRQGGSALGNVWENISSRVAGAADAVSDSASRLANGAVPNGAGGSMSDTASRLSHRAGEAMDDTMARASSAAREASRRVSRMISQRGDWMPGMRNSAMLGGGLLGLYGLMRRSPIGMLAGVAGLAVLARGVSQNRGLASMLGARTLGKTIDIEKSIQIDASPEDVYDLWSNYENFPRFMSHVVQVRDLGRRRSHWVVRGPAGSHFEWDSVLTEQSRPHRLAWRSEPGAEIGQSGSVQFEPYRGGTLVTVRMSYSPPAGAIGHGIASLLGADPGQQMDDDLARMKMIVERGSLPQHMAKQGGFLSRWLH